MIHYTIFTISTDTFIVRVRILLADHFSLWIEIRQHDERDVQPLRPEQLNVWRKIGPADGTNGNAQRIEIQVGVVEFRQNGQQEFSASPSTRITPLEKNSSPRVTSM